jgi:cell wall assembly regulator SMI1
VFQNELLLPVLFHKGRIPFAHDGSGNYLCIDFVPGEKGKSGQILYVPCGDPEPLSVIFWSFDDYIDFLIAALKTERINLFDDREDYDEDDRDLADVYFYKNWRDDWMDIAGELK